MSLSLPELIFVCEAKAFCYHEDIRTDTHTGEGVVFVYLLPRP